MHILHFNRLYFFLTVKATHTYLKSKVWKSIKIRPLPKGNHRKVLVIKSGNFLF